MKKNLVKLVLGKSAQDKYSAELLQTHLHRIKRVWEGEDYKDFGIERLFRLLLMCSKLLFPRVYIDHLVTRYSRLNRKIWGEFYVLFKVFFPLFILYFHLAGVSILLFINVYLLLETFIFIFSRIYVSEHFSSEGYKRSLLLLFMNFLETVLSFAVMYSYGNYLSKPLDNPIDAVYFSMMTTMTVGYGDIHPVTDAGKVVAMLQSLSSLTFLVLFFNFFNSKIED